MSDWDLLDEDYNDELDAALRRRPQGRADFDLDYEGRSDDE